MKGAFAVSIVMMLIIAGVVGIHIARGAEDQAHGPTSKRLGEQPHARIKNAHLKHRIGHRSARRSGI